MAAKKAETRDSGDAEAKEADERQDADGAEEHGGEQKERGRGCAKDGGDEAEDDLDDGQWGLGARALGGESPSLVCSLRMEDWVRLFGDAGLFWGQASEEEVRLPG